MKLDFILLSAFPCLFQYVYSTKVVAEKMQPSQTFMVCEAVGYLNKLLRYKSSRAVTHRRSACALDSRRSVFFHCVYSTEVVAEKMQPEQTFMVCEAVDYQKKLLRYKSSRAVTHRRHSASRKIRLQNRRKDNIM